MDAIAIIVGLSWTFAGLAIIAVAIPLAGGQVGRNRFYGIRFRQSFQSDDAWYAINRYGGRRLIVWAIPLVLVGILCSFLPMQGHPRWAVVLGIAPLVFVLIPVFEAWRFARKYRPGK